MPGLAKTNEFMLGTASVMIGPMADLNQLNPTDNGIGLVKNFTFTSEPSYTELSQGVQNNIVYSIMTNNPVRATMEAYEYTAKNLMYALGLENDGIVKNTVTTAVNGAIEGGSPAADELVVDSATGITVGKFIMILIDGEDNFIVRKVTAVDSNTLTVDEELPDVPDNAVVKVVHEIGVGAKTEQPFYSAKVAGKLANGEQVVILIPKLRIVKGFNLAFVQNDFANLPLEFTVYDQVATDPFYAEYGGKQARLFRS